MPGGPDGRRDVNELLAQLLAPFRSEAAAFRFLLWTVGVAAVVIVAVLAARALT